MEQLNEIWKPISGFEGRYEVSNLGRVKSLARPTRCLYNNCKMLKDTILYGSKDKEGYIQISLKIDGKESKRKMHRLVAEAFVVNEDNKPEVNHIDFIRANNRADNLEWTTRKENQNHSVLADRTNRGGRTPGAVMVLDLQTGIFYETIKEASVAKGIRYGALKSGLSAGKKTYKSITHV